MRFNRTPPSRKVKLLAIPLLQLKAQTAFAGAAEDMGVSCEEDVQALVDAVRYGKDT